MPSWTLSRTHQNSMNINSSLPALSLQSDDLVGAAKPTKIHDAAQQFEALMIGEMLKDVRGSGPGWLGDDDDSDSGNDSAMDMAESQLGTALAKGGGLGLSKMIEQTLGPRSGVQNVNAAPDSQLTVSPK